KSGRADRRGGNRIAIFLLGTWAVSWALGSRHWFDVNEETNRFFRLLALALLNVGFTWLFYLALEPFVRRQSPDTLIGWTRLLVGHLRDPRVGRDILIGVASGVLFALVASLDAVLPLLTGAPPEQPRTSDMAYFMGGRYAIADMLRVLANALQNAMLGTFTFVIVLAIVRRQWLAATLVLVLVCGLIVADADIRNIWFAVGRVAVLGALLIAVFLRFGLLALASALYVNAVLHAVPLTIDLSRPHAGVSTVAILLVAALAVYGFRVSGAGAGMFRRLFAVP
ncbi:MAG TPA: hypothetical protein VG106_06100, partial [Vicinamibacterales bacterium]|nr:hypothetical protein [Vicinamibacterales bacterium]